MMISEGTPTVASSIRDHRELVATVTDGKLMNRSTCFASFVVFVFVWSCTAAAQSPRSVLLASPGSAPVQEPSLSEKVRREVGRRLSPARSVSSAVSLELTWEWVHGSSNPGPWIDEPCLPNPSPDTPPALTDTCGKIRGTPSSQRTLVGTARIRARTCTTAVGPVRGSEKRATGAVAERVVQAVAKLDMAATCQDAGWVPSES